MNHINNITGRVHAIVICVMVSVIILFPQFISAQESNLESEMELGLAYFQDAQFKEAFPYFEKISVALSNSGDEESLPIIYYFCHSCKYLSGDIVGSIPYGENAIKFETLPSELKIQVLKSLLNAYDELACQDKCLNTIDQLKILWKSYKATDIIESLVAYYSIHEEYANVILLEKDLQYIHNTNASNEMDQRSNMIQINTIYMCMAKAYSELKDFSKSLSYLEKCIETLTPSTQENKSTIYLMMADNYNKMGDKKSALKYQKLAIDTE